MKRYRVTYGSERMPHRTVRRIVKRLLQLHVEPEPRYRTGKFWTD